MEGILTSNLSSWVVVSMVSALLNVLQIVIKTWFQAWTEISKYGWEIVTLCCSQPVMWHYNEQSKISGLGEFVLPLSKHFPLKPFFRRHMHYLVSLWMILDKLFQMLAGVAYCPKWLLLSQQLLKCLPCAIWPGLGSDLCVPEQQVALEWPSAGLVPQPPRELSCAQCWLCTTLKRVRLT